MNISPELQYKLEAPPSPSAFKEGTRVGPFRLLRPIGRGGMGEVWLAEQADGRVTRQVALKLPALYLRGSLWEERFHRERDSLAKLAHPGIARLYDAGVSESGQPYLAMEPIDGVSLTDYVKSQGLGIRTQLQLFRQVLAAIGHAHRHLVVHRDLKPANILVDHSGQAKLLDFGIAKLLDDVDAAADAGDLTRMGGRAMTLRYAAPEQAAGADITTATDVYALGVILGELVADAVPDRGTVRDLDAIVLKATRPEPAARYASVEQFDDDVARLLEHRPVMARKGTWTYLAGRFAARHKLPLTMAAAVVVTLAVALVMADRQRRLAVAERARAETHFASVRQLANSFMFDVHGAIQNLAGSLKAREMLVKTSLEYLDALQGEAGNDPELLHELAVAYRKVGDIQGQVGNANKGDLLAAIGNYEKSERLFMALEAVRPGDIKAMRERVMLKHGLARTYYLQVDPRWEAEIATTIVLAQRVAASSGATPADRAREVVTLAEQAMLTSFLRGMTPEIEATMRRAVASIEALASEAPGDAIVRQSLITIYEMAAKALAPNKRSADATEGIGYFRKGLEVIRVARAAYPDDAKLADSEQSFLMQLSSVLRLHGQQREADRAVAEAVQLGAKLAARDPTNVMATSSYIDALNASALGAYREGDPPRAIRFARESLALSAGLPEGTRTSRDMRASIVEAKAILGASLLASASGPAPDRRAKLALLTEARSLLADAVAFVDRIRADKEPSRFFEGADDEIRAAFKLCNEALAKLSRT